MIDCVEFIEASKDAGLFPERISVVSKLSSCELQ